MRRLHVLKSGPKKPIRVNKSNGNNGSAIPRPAQPTTPISSGAHPKQGRRQFFFIIHNVKQRGCQFENVSRRLFTALFSPKTCRDNSLLLEKCKIR